MLLKGQLYIDLVSVSCYLGQIIPLGLSFYIYKMGETVSCAVSMRTAVENVCKGPDANKCITSGSWYYPPFPKGVVSSAVLPLIHCCHMGLSTPGCPCVVQSELA